jgi:hypothetical protein
MIHALTAGLSPANNSHNRKPGLDIPPSFIQTIWEHEGRLVQDGRVSREAEAVDETASFRGRAERLAALVAAVAGAVVISRAERRPFRCLGSPLRSRR